MYNFLFDKKSLVLLLTGLGVAGGVLFFAGVLVGVQWGLPLGTAPVAAPPHPATKRAAVQAADRPCRPEPQAVPVAPVAVTAAPPHPEPLVSAAPAPEPKPEPVRPAPAPVTPPAPAAPAPVVAQAPARPPEPEAAPEPAADGPGRYSLQIGAFRDAKNSEKVIQDLQTRGYEPYVVEQRGRSLLRTVRVGRYAGRAEALRAASEFRRRERMEAIVRPAGS